MKKNCYTLLVPEEMAREARKVAERFRRDAASNIHCDFDWGTKVNVFQLLTTLAEGQFDSPKQAMDVVKSISRIKSQMEIMAEEYCPPDYNDYMVFHDSYSTELITMRKQIDMALQAESRHGGRR